MKVAISLPESVYDSAEVLIKRLGVSRSELYARAIEEYVAKHRQRKITDALDSVYADTDSALPRPFASAQRRAVGDRSW